MLGKDELEKMARSKEKKTMPRAQEGVNAVLLQDILSSISSTTVVLKMDIEGYECKVTALLWRSNYSGLYSCHELSNDCFTGFADVNSFRRTWKVHSSHLFGVGQGCQVLETLMSSKFSMVDDGHWTYSLFVLKRIFSRDSINCPEYESWKTAFLSGGFLPYESSKLILTIVLSSILWLAFIIDVVISTVKDLITQIWNSYIQRGVFDASLTMDPLTRSPIFCGFTGASSWEAQHVKRVLLNNV